MSKKVLVVDDMPINLMIARGLLEELGLLTDTATDGLKALQLALENYYDVVLLDYHMPNMNGEETLIRLRSEIYSTREVCPPIIVMTGDSDEGARARFLDIGFSDYIRKPIDINDLRIVLSRYIDITDFKSSGSDKSDDSSYKEILKRLGDTRELNISAGVLLCGSETLYLDAVRIFSKSALDRANELEKLYKDKDILTFGQKCHAIKSPLKVIGADELSEMAEILEKSASIYNNGVIDDKTPDFLLNLKVLAESLDAVFTAFDYLENPDTNSTLLPKITKAQLEDAYNTLYEFLLLFDYNSMQIVLDSLDGFSLDADESDFFSELNVALSMIDRDRMKELLNDKVKKGDRT